MTDGEDAVRVEVAHTPGPWEALGGTAVRTVRADDGSGGYRIAFLYGADATPDREEREANARLIGAAPDLFAALVAAETLLNHMGDVLNGMDAVTDEDEAMATPIFAAVRAAITLATEGR
jgi:hypothetical protein